MSNIIYRYAHQKERMVLCIINIKFLTDSAELNLSEIARITNIDGLGAVTAAINTTQIGLNPGTRFASVHVDYRNIVIEFYVISNVAGQSETNCIPSFKQERRQRYN